MRLPSPARADARRRPPLANFTDMLGFGARGAAKKGHTTALHAHQQQPLEDCPRLNEPHGDSEWQIVILLHVLPTALALRIITVDKFGESSQVTRRPHAKRSCLHAKRVGDQVLQEPCVA